MRRTNGPSRGRSVTFLAILIVAALAFAFKLIDVQMVSAGALQQESKDRRAVPITLASVRGNIVDRNGDVLATTDERYDVQLSPKNTKLNGAQFPRPDLERGVGTILVTSEEAFAEIAEITGQTADEIKEIVDDALEDNPNSDFAYVKRGVDLTQLQQLKRLQIPWLTFESQHRRVYPNGAVGGNIIGFAGQDEVAQAGVELSQDACLVGEDGTEVYERGADGVQLPGSLVQTKEVVNGGTVELTLDRDLQWQAQQIADQKKQEFGAEYVYIVIQNAKTGELLAVAEDGSVDPNDVGAVDDLRRNARSFTLPYEPGSTFKVITAAALLEEGKATPGTSTLADDTWEPEAGVRFGDSFTHAPRNWTLTGALMFSSNVAVAQLGNKLSPEVRYEYLEKFGIGQSTNAGMPLEDAGWLTDSSQWDAQTSYVTMFGQGLSSTIVQTAGVFQTFANGGVRVPPSVVASCTTADGEVSKLDHGDPVRVVSEKTADETLAMLETVANEAYLVKDSVKIPGYRIGGKTATAEQSDGQGGYRPDFVYSFAGVFPIDDPQYVIVATVAYPTTGHGTTGSVTAFRDAAEAVIRQYDIPPSSGSYEKLDIGDDL